MVRFLDRFLSGTQFVYASADGAGFLQMSGIDAEAWEKRIEQRQATYRKGLGDARELSRKTHGKEFVDLTDQEQDDLLEELSGKPKPARVSLVGHGKNAGEGGLRPPTSPSATKASGSSTASSPHTARVLRRPAYGGNDNFTGWNVIGYPGPRSLKDTMDGTFTTTDYMLMDATWPYANHPSVQRYRLHRPKS